MKAEIVAINDENFNIEVKKFGEQYLATDGERVVIGATEDHAVNGVVDLQDQNKLVEGSGRAPKPAPLENHQSSGIGWFEGTSWSTSDNRHKF